MREQGRAVGFDVLVQAQARHRLRQDRGERVALRTANGRSINAQAQEDFWQPILRIGARIALRIGTQWLDRA